MAIDFGALKMSKEQQAAVLAEMAKERAAGKAEALASKKGQSSLTVRATSDGEGITFGRFNGKRREFITIPVGELVEEVAKVKAALDSGAPFPAEMWNGTEFVDCEPVKLTTTRTPRDKRTFQARATVPAGQPAAANLPPEPMIALVMSKHGLTRDYAIQAIKGGLV